MLRSHTVSRAAYFNIVFGAAVASASIALTACGGGSSSGHSSVYSVSASVLGLAAGQSVVLQNNAGDNMTVSANGTTAFATSLAGGTAYAVTVLTPPTGQTCTAQSGTGSVRSANVTVQVVCVHTSTDAALDGAYAEVGFTIVNSGVFVGIESAPQYDGMGGITGTLTLDAEGMLLTNFMGPSGYTLDNGSLVASGAVYGGADGAAGNILVIGDVTSTVSPSLGVDVKQGSGMSLASLVGSGASATYISAEYNVGLVTGFTPIGRGGTLTINADGSGSFAGSTNTGGTIAPESDSYLAGSITVSGTGSFTMPVANTVGAVSPDYDLIIRTFVGATEPTPANLPGIFAAVRTGSGSSLSTLDGQYTVASFSDPTAGSNGEGQVLTFLLDGQGNYTASGSDNTSGVITAYTGSGQYTVANSGAVTVTSAGNTFNGGVSADGKVFVLYQITSGSTPVMLVGVRQ